MTRSFIVVEDTQGLFGVGHVMAPPEGVKFQRDRRIAIMPVVPPQEAGYGGVQRWTKREFGRGIELQPAHPRAVARLALYVAEPSTVLHWRVRVLRQTPMLSAEDRVEWLAKNPHRGSMRLVSDTSQGIPTCGVSTVEQLNFDQLGDETEPGKGWVVGGVARATTQSPSVYGFSLYGVGHGFRVVWAALTQE